MRLDKGAMSMALLLLLAYLMVGSGQERSIRSAGPAAFPSNLVSSEFCHDRDFVFYLQREMWMMAREETFESQQTKFVDEKLELYELSFGAVEVAISEAKKPAAKPKPQPTPQRNRGRGSVAMPGATGSNEGRSVSEPLHSMTYYRIFKNANDNIRSIMAELAYAISDENKAFRALNCYKSECIHHLLHERSPHALKNMYISPNRAKRFSFTFVRDPIDRFIAGMTEIEYRYQQATANAPSSDALSLQQPLGSTLRVEEFIRMILDSDGSYAWLKRQPQVEMMHIVPMIGTLLLGEHVEGRPLNLYKFEDFDSEWERLSKESGLPILLGLYRNRSSQQWARHPSSSDPYSTTSAAREFFSFASPDALMRFGNGSDARQRTPPQGYALLPYKQMAQKSLRALCRIYLSDYLCTGYPLPSDCEDVLEDAKRVRTEYLQLRSDEQSFDDITDLLRLILPTSWLQLYAYFKCFQAESPECEARILLGAEHEVPERHDEL